MFASHIHRNERIATLAFLARDVIYTSRLCYDVSVRLCCLHGRRAARRAACGRIISRHVSQC